MKGIIVMGKKQNCTKLSELNMPNELRNETNHIIDIYKEHFSYKFNVFITGFYLNGNSICKKAFILNIVLKDEDFIDGMNLAQDFSTGDVQVFIEKESIFKNNMNDVLEGGVYCVL